MEDFFAGMLPKRLGQVLIKAAGVYPLSISAKELSDRQISAIESTVCGWELPVLGTLGLDQAQVTTGGAEIHAFDENTLESRLADGVFAAGEVLDVDGDCGGFNLQNAWETGIKAARGIIDGEI
jgi:predicted flavoprotein YhiN